MVTHRAPIKTQNQPYLSVGHGTDDSSLSCFHSGWVCMAIGGRPTPPRISFSWTTGFNLPWRVLWARVASALTHIHGNFSHLRTRLESGPLPGMPFSDLPFKPLSCIPADSPSQSCRHGSSRILDVCPLAFLLSRETRSPAPVTPDLLCPVAWHTESQLLFHFVSSAEYWLFLGARTAVLSKAA